jgi:hypothetical protein
MRARIVTAAILVAGFTAILAVNLPGQLSYDSVAQLFEGRTGHYNSWHPPVMAWLLGLFDALLPGPSLFVVFQAALVLGALLSILWLRRRVSWAAAGMAFLCLLTPQFFLYQGAVWKDVLFADAAVAGFVALAQAAVHWQRPRLRFGLIVLAFLLLALAAMTRQNGVIALAAGGIALAVIARRKGASAGQGGAAFLAALLFSVTVSFALAARGDGGDGARAELVMLQIYDMTGMMHAQSGLVLEKIHARDPRLETVLRGDGVRLYTPVRNDTLYAAPVLVQAIGSAPPGLVFGQWQALVLAHPLAYLAMRARLFDWVFLTPDILACRPTYTGIDGPSAVLKTLGLTARVRPRDRALTFYALRFAGTPIFSHPAFAAVALGCLFLLLRRRRSADIVFAFLLGGVFVFAASFFFISVACDYRYLYFLDLSVLATLFYLAADPGGFVTESAGPRTIPG